MLCCFALCCFNLCGSHFSGLDIGISLAGIHYCGLVCITDRFFVLSDINIVCIRLHSVCIDHIDVHNNILRHSALYTDRCLKQNVFAVNIVKLIFKLGEIDIAVIIRRTVTHHLYIAHPVKIHYHAAGFNVVEFTKFKRKQEINTIYASVIFHLNRCEAKIAV